MSTENRSIYGLKACCAISGASRGLGRTIALEFASVFDRQSSFVLTGRNASKLNETRNDMLAKCPKLDVHVLPLDLATLDFSAFEDCLKKIVSSCTFDLGLIVHNAGSLTSGDRTQRCKDMLDVNSVRTYFDINLTSVIGLNAVFLKHFPEKNCKRRTVINVSSLAALQPFKTWSLYCAGKSARDMFFHTLAVEETSIRVLNYAPGPLKTDMGEQTRTATEDEELRNMMAECFKNGQFLECETTVAKLLTILEKNTFVSGSHVDYYDE